MKLGPPSKSITVPDVIICVAVAGLGLLGGELWTALLCGLAMASTIALWRILWFVGHRWERD